MSNNIRKLSEEFLSKYMNDRIKSLEPIRFEEAKLVISIKKEFDPVVVKMGDYKSGFLPSKKKYDKLAEYLREAKNGEHTYIVWDDLIEFKRVGDNR